MHTISFQVDDSDLQRFLLLSKQVKKSTDILLNDAFNSYIEDLEDYIQAKTVFVSDEPLYTLAEVEASLGLADQI